MTIAGKPKLIRKINRSLLIEVFREKQLITSTELVKITGLSRRTINLIVTSLMKKEIVVENGYGNSTNEGGKRPVIYKFNPNSFYSIGILVREYTIRIGICNLNGEILFKDSVIVEWQNGYEGTCSQIVKLVKIIIDKSEINFSKFLGVGIALPGLVNSPKGLVKLLTRHEGWENIELVKILKKELNLHIEIENEVHIRAFGEKWFGIAKKIKNFVNIFTTADGIGCGVMINHELIRSYNLLPGKLGHIKIGDVNKKFGDLLDFEYFLSLKYINDLVLSNKKSKLFPKSPLSQIFNLNSEIKMEDLFSNYNLGDEFSNIIVEKLINNFAFLINIIVCSYDPELIIIHGKYSMLDDRFFEKVIVIIQDSIFPTLKKKIVIKKSLQSTEAAILGAAGMVLNETLI